MSDNDDRKPSVLDRISAFLMREPEDREQLLQLLHSAHERDLLDADALAMIEGVLQVSEMQARDIMIPRSQMDVIDIGESPAQFIPMVIQTAHSRFPVIGENKDNVIGILLAKDLLRYYAGEEEFNVREMLRPAVFIPESKPLNVLLKEFRASRNHIAIVVDEYGGVAGLVTIEDVLEQIVGDIEDEHDEINIDEIEQLETGEIICEGMVLIRDFSKKTGIDLHSSSGVSTIAGLIINIAHKIPKIGDIHQCGDYALEVIDADAHKIHKVKFTKNIFENTEE